MRPETEKYIMLVSSNKKTWTSHEINSNELLPNGVTTYNFYFKHLLTE